MTIAVRNGRDWRNDACPLCSGEFTRAFAEIGDAAYRCCLSCGLVFQRPDQHPDALTELGIYTAHDNRVDDPGYREFLGRLTRHLVPRLPAGARGLDFGAGPGPALAAMLTEQGFPMTLYDPFFSPDEQALAREYDFIVCTECAEHFHRPGEAFERLRQLLRPGGVLGLMTRILDPSIDFARWHYHRDPTHVSFYTPAAIAWLGCRFDWEWQRYGEDVVIFTDRATGN